MRAANVALCVVVLGVAAGCSQHEAFTSTFAFEVPARIQSALAPGDTLEAILIIRAIVGTNEDAWEDAVPRITLDATQELMTHSVNIPAGDYRVEVEFSVARPDESGSLRLMNRWADIALDDGQETKVDFSTETSHPGIETEDRWDEDGDGWSNLDELTAGSNPREFLLNWANDLSGMFVPSPSGYDITVEVVGDGGVIAQAGGETSTPILVYNDDGTERWRASYTRFAVDTVNEEVVALDASESDELLAVKGLNAHDKTENWSRDLGGFDLYLSESILLHTDGTLWMGALQKLGRIGKAGASVDVWTDIDWTAMTACTTGEVEMRSYDANRLLISVPKGAACDETGLGLLSTAGPKPSVTWTCDLTGSAGDLAGMTIGSDGAIYKLAGSILQVIHPGDASSDWSHKVVTDEEFVGGDGWAPLLTSWGDIWVVLGLETPAKAASESQRLIVLDGSTSPPQEKWRRNLFFRSYTYGTDPDTYMFELAGQERVLLPGDVYPSQEQGIVYASSVLVVTADGVVKFRGPIADRGSMVRTNGSDTYYYGGDWHSATADSDCPDGEACVVAVTIPPAPSD